MGCGIIINFFGSIKQFLNGDKKSIPLKIDEESSRTFFLKDITLGELDSEYLNELIDILVGWYRVRMPDSVFVKNGNNVFINKQNVSYKNYKKMSFEQLLKRNSDLYLLKCKYRSDRVYSKKELPLKIYTTTGFFNNKEDKVCTIVVNRENGKIIRIEGDNVLPEYIMDNYLNYTLHDILDLLNNEKIENLNYNSLIECVANRKKDLDARDQIIDTVCLELFDSDDKDYGYYRAFTFFKEITSFLDLKFNSNYLDNFGGKIYNIKNDIKERHMVKSKKIQH